MSNKFHIYTLTILFQNNYNNDNNNYCSNEYLYFKLKSKLWLFIDFVSDMTGQVENNLQCWYADQ